MKLVELGDVTNPSQNLSCLLRALEINAPARVYSLNVLSCLRCRVPKLLQTKTDEAQMLNEAFAMVRLLT